MGEFYGVSVFRRIFLLFLYKNRFYFIDRQIFLNLNFIPFKKNKIK